MYPQIISDSQHPLSFTPNKRLLTLADHAVLGERKENPQAKAANILTKQLCQQYGIYHPKFDTYNTMSGYVYPHTSMRMLAYINLWVDLLWYIDVLYDRNINHEYSENMPELKRVLITAVDIVCDGYQPEEVHPIYPVCFALHEWLVADCAEHWIPRFKQSFLNHLLSCTYTGQETGEQEQLTVEQFITLREQDGGMYPMIDLIEPALGIYLPDEVLQHETTKQLSLLTCRLGCLSNDIFSYEREVLHQGTRFNLIRVIMDNEACTFAEALHESISIINRDSAMFVELANNLPSFGNEQLDEDVHQYVMALQDQIIATYHWQLSTNRYRSINSPHPELRTMLPVHITHAS